MKPGYKTTEFWFSLLASLVSALIASGLAGNNDLVLKIFGIVSLTLAGLGYTAARTIAKRGSFPVVSTGSGSGLRNSKLRGQREVQHDRMKDFLLPGATMNFEIFRDREGRSFDLLILSLNAGAGSISSFSIEDIEIGESSIWSSPTPANHLGFPVVIFEGPPSITPDQKIKVTVKNTSTKEAAFSGDMIARVL